MSTVKILIMLIMAGVPLAAAFYYIRKKRVFFLPTTDHIRDGQNKIRFVAKKKENYTSSWNGKRCLYYRVIVDRAVSQRYMADFFDEHNIFIAQMNSSSVEIDTQNVQFRFEKSPEIFIRVPSSWINSRLSSPGEKRRFYKKCFLEGIQVAKMSSATYQFSDFTVNDGQEYILLAHFTDGTLDMSRDIFIIDSERAIKRYILFMAGMFAAPGIIILLLLGRLLVSVHK